uniref:Damage-control phosphatase ARMT1-like metal-binding domain-containing protein n=1 Tax=Timema bartmani TaxID=61472 RepID=A0A7R9HZV8_9NEOP|nr:unnamed protein product [Timema bartmani]
MLSGRRLYRSLEPHIVTLLALYQLYFNQFLVILCANSAPALNDVTHVELVGVLKQVAEICGVIRRGLEEGRLVTMETGQGGPCLDLSRLDQSLAAALQEKVDLVVIEGMGRAVHTNLHAVFTCECLKMAVIKNRWLANRLGGDMFSVICKVHPSPSLAEEGKTQDGLWLEATDKSYTGVSLRSFYQLESFNTRLR